MTERCRCKNDAFKIEGYNAHKEAIEVTCSTCGQEYVLDWDGTLLLKDGS